MKIGFYDSGLGGIKTLKDIINMGLKGEIYFLADTKNSPYGTKSSEEVKSLAKGNVKKLVDLGCEIIVVACNTATSVAIEDLRKEFLNIDIIGTEPAIKLAVDEHLHKNILILATTITAKGEKLNKLIKKLNPDVKVEILPADRLVKLIEDENFLNNQKEVNSYLEELFSQYDLDTFSHIILGCTHFPIVKENIEKIVKENNIKVIDGNNGIGKNLLGKIETKGKLEEENIIHIVTTRKSIAFEKRLKEILQDIKYEIM